jgi:two-component system, OmpR family, response regulator RegX3
MVQPTELRKRAHIGGEPLLTSCQPADVRPGEATECGDFSIDMRGRRVALRGQELELSTEEFDVFVFLASHSRGLVTSHTVLVTSWTTNRLRQTEFLKALISLRRKLETAGPGKHYLRTEPWVVYRFNPISSA